MLYESLKKYIVLVRAYSIIDVLLLLLLAKTLGRFGAPFGFAGLVKDSVAAAMVLMMWGVLTLALEATHKHAYREQIRYGVPALFLMLSSLLAYFVNPQALIFIFFVCLFTLFYIKKEMNKFWGMTSSLWRGLYQVALFFTCLSFYVDIRSASWREVWVGLAILCFYLSRNLIADVRDVAFDKLTLVVFWGSKKSYLIALLSFVVGDIVLFFAFPHMLVLFPAFVFTTLLLWYDDGFMLHRLSIMVTSFTFANITLYLKMGSPVLLYPNLLFLVILTNFLFYEKVARPSNPIQRVPSHARFLFRNSS